MLVLLWNVSAAIRGYLRFYMPTNRALDWLRSPRGLKWAIPAAVIATPTYLFAMSICGVVAMRPGFGWLNVLVVVFFWNALKFAWMAGLAPLVGMARRCRQRVAECHQVDAGPTATGPVA